MSANRPRAAARAGASDTVDLREDTVNAPADLADLIGEPLWITETEVVAALHLGEAIDALERCLLLEAGGQACAMAKTHATWGDGHTLHAIGAVIEGAGVVGTKSWAHTGGGATPL